ncbi:hypothetical protein [Rhizobium sp. KDH_Rht_773_N]|jgi:hypothetical protein
MKPLHYLLIIFAGPPFLAAALALVFFVMASPHNEQADPRPTGTIGVRKGGRLGSPGDLVTPHRPGGDFR